MTTSQKTHAEVRAWYLRYLSCCQEYRFDDLDEFVNQDFRLQKGSGGLEGFKENLRAAVRAWPKLVYEWHPIKIAIDLEQGPMICVWFDMYYERDGEKKHFQETAFYRMREGKMGEAKVMFWGGMPEGGPSTSDSDFDREKRKD